VTDLCQFGKDLFSISKVISRKTKWPGFLAYPVVKAIIAKCAMLLTIALFML